jgi:dipeptidyl aminopeptidase/acylaminoacyl peptidase
VTNAQIDALIRRVDVSSAPDAAFVASSHRALVARVRAARERDASWFGRLRRDARLAPRTWSSVGRSRTASLVLVLVLAALALAAGLAIIGATQREAPLGNGRLIVSVHGQLEAVDPTNGSAVAILLAGKRAEGVSRSPDGRIATFWVNEGGRSRLFAIGADGRDLRELATGMDVTWGDSIDTWSADSHVLATEVTLEGAARILLVDVATGAATPVTPANISAHNPLWSPDGRWIAFTPDTPSGRSLSVIRTDGTGMHDVAGDLNGLDVSGPDTWSPDGVWIYFNANGPTESHVFRANVPGRFSQQLTGDEVEAAAVASSPDGTKIAFMVDAGYGFDLWVADSDGRRAHRILEQAGLGGWSSDGQFIVVRWKPIDIAKGGLGIVRPDGTNLTILVPYDPSCRQGWDQSCELGFGWGQARP